MNEHQEHPEPADDEPEGSCLGTEERWEELLGDCERDEA